jgi:hypothetical protein
MCGRRLSRGQDRLHELGLLLTAVPGGPPPIHSRERVHARERCGRWPGGSAGARVSTCERHTDDVVIASSKLLNVHG